MADPSSVVLVTKYGTEAIRLIRSATSSLTYVIYVTAALVVFTLLDLFGVLYQFRLYSEVQHDYVVSVIALVLLGVLFPLVWRVVRARTALDSWQDVFERGSLQMGIRMAMARRDKGEALKAVAETVAELEPLRQYFATAGTLQFIDVTRSGVTFDGLVDESLVESDELKRLLKDYGAIVIALADIADSSQVKDFRQRIRTYSDNTGQESGVAVMVAGEITEAARREADGILMVEKGSGE